MQEWSGAPNRRETCAVTLSGERDEPRPRAPMTPERWRVVDAVLRDALTRAPIDRAAHVAQACADDADLRREVESLLAANVADDFLERPAMSADTPASTLLTGALAGRYTIERELGRGGMATVYLARDLRHRRLVALKVLDPKLGTLLGPSRFTREIETAARLSHPHILPLHDSAEADGVLFYVMPYVAGGSLREQLRRHDGPLPIGQTLRLVRQVGAALDYAHRHDVVHRDVKPENILLDEEGHALVADFGIARALQRATTAGSASLSRDAAETLTQTGAVIGTPAYMSPEQALGRHDIDGRSDQYSLGCVAFELLAGASPFTGTSTEQLSQRFTQPPSIASRRPDLPQAVDAVLARALALAPARRFDTVTAFADALADALSRVPHEEGARGDVGAPPAHLVGGRRSVARRRTVVAVALGVIALATVYGTLIRTRETGSTSPSRPADTRAAAAADARLSVPSLAVLPLRNYSGDAAQDYFAGGLTDELTTTLAKIAGLRVIAHQSMRQFANSDRPVAEIARLLGVRHVVAGSVLRDGDRVRITVTLVDPTTDAQLWSERFERQRRDVLALQREVALAIARAIEITLTPQDRERLAGAPEVDPVVFELYLRGTQLRYKAFGPLNREAATYFERAIALDSTYAPAYAGLAALHILTGEEARARVLVRKALALDSGFAEGHVVLGLSQQLYGRDWAGAERSFREAIRLNPGYAEAHHELSMLLMRQRRFDEAIREARLTLYLAPMSARFEQGLGEVYLSSGRHADALLQVKKALAIENAAYSHHLHAAVLADLGRFPEAQLVLEGCIPRGCGEFGRALLGYVYARTGRRAEALRIVDMLRAQWTVGKRVSAIPYLTAEVFAGLEERARALDWLERGVEQDTHILYAYVAIDPALRSLQREPRFRALLRKLGLPD